MMAVGGDILKPSYEDLARLNVMVADARKKTVEKIEHHGDDRDFARAAWRQFQAEIAPLLRETEAVQKTITDYYAAQAMAAVAR